MLHAAASALAVGTVIFPKGVLHAESPSELNLSRKPIYDDPVPPTRAPRFNTPSKPDSPAPSAPSSSPTPTDRLAAQVRVARIFLHDQTSVAETKFNSLMDSILHLENSFTSTIASLAPPPEAHENLMPGGIYVIVAAMAGSIISRNRNILLRATVPVAVGIGAGWMLLPVTMGNVSDLLWKYEEKVPVVAENHLRVKGAVEQGVRMTVVHAQLARGWAEEKVKDAREVVEGWVSQGR